MSTLDYGAELAEMLTQPEPAPRAGLYPDVRMETYQRWPCASQSRLTHLERSPAHLRAVLQQVPEPTDAKAFGTAAHYAALEPDLFELRYVKGPCEDRRVKAWIEFEKAHSAMVVLRPSDWAACMAVRDSLLAHPAARLALNHRGPRELSGVWVDEETKVPCKLRIDHLNPELRATVEIKTALDAREDAFSRAIFNYKYYRQGAWYLLGMAALQPEIDWKHHIIVSVEKEPPFAVNVFRLRDDALQAGRDELRPLLARYKECIERDEWPAYLPTTFNEISLPPWSWQKIDQQLDRKS